MNDTLVAGVDDASIVGVADASVVCMNDALATGEGGISGAVLAISMPAAGTNTPMVGIGDAPIVGVDNAPVANPVHFRAPVADEDSPIPARVTWRFRK